MNNRIPGLDGLRGISILLVLASHVPLFSQERGEFNFGRLGVDIFFVLSGFLITRILLNSSGKHPLRDFWKRRALRVFPIYFIVLAVFLCVYGPKRELLYLMTYLQNFYYALGHGVMPAHTWSLAVEEQFYFVWPLASIFLSRKKSFRLALGMYFVVIVIISIMPWIGAHFGMEQSITERLMYRSPFTRGLSILLGVTYAYYENGLKDYHGTWILGFFFLVLAYINGTKYVSNELMCNSFCAGGLFLIAISNKCPLIFQNKSLMFIGTISYGLYLYHGCIFNALNVSHLSEPSVMIPVALAMTFITAFLSFYLIEKPILNLGKTK